MEIDRMWGIRKGWKSSQAKSREHQNRGASKDCPPWNCSHTKEDPIHQIIRHPLMTAPTLRDELGTIREKCRTSRNIRRRRRRRRRRRSTLLAEASGKRTLMQPPSVVVDGAYKTHASCIVC